MDLGSVYGKIFDKDLCKLVRATIWSYAFAGIQSQMKTIWNRSYKNFTTILFNENRNEVIFCQMKIESNPVWIQMPHHLLAKSLQVEITCKLWRSGKISRCLPFELRLKNIILSLLFLDPFPSLLPRPLQSPRHLLWLIKWICFYKCFLLALVNSWINLVD